jgi:hypothetical protein
MGIKSRARRLGLWAAACAVMAAALACGDSGDTPLGSEFIGGLLGSKPGVVFADSFRMAGGDTSYASYTTIGGVDYMEVGLDNQYRRTVMLRGDFSSAGDESSLPVERANLRLHAIPDDQSIPTYVQDIDVVFHNLATPYYEDSAVVSLDTTWAIPDPDNGGAVNRVISLGIIPYALPPELVQGWIRGDSLNNGISITYAKAQNELFGIYTRIAASDSRPSIQVYFEGRTTPVNYPIGADGTFVRPTTSSDNLVISDGFVRRIHLKLDLSEIDDSAAVHDARLVLNYVPGTVFGTNQDVIFYAPNSADPSSSDFAKGQLITQRTLDESAGVLELRITNALLAVLSGELEDNGFALRFANLNTEVRQAEFYGSGHPSLGPQVYVTYSTPADFKE